MIDSIFCGTLSTHRDVQVAGVLEVSHIGPIWPLADIQSADGFGDEPVEIGVALTMRVGRQIDRYVVPKRREVGAVIEIPAAQVILIGLAGVGVHDRHQAGRRFEDFAGARDRPGINVLAGNRHLARHAWRHHRAAGDVGSAGLIGRRRRRCRRGGLGGYVLRLFRW